MRLPLASDIKTRDGTLTKDAKVKNAYADSEQAAVRVRPGNNDLGSLGGAGLAQLLAEWNGLLAVSGDSLLGLSIVPESDYTATVGANTLDDYFWAHGGAIFAIDTALGNVMRSADGGATSSVKSAIPDVLQACPVSFLGNIYYFGTTNTYSSADDGATWNNEGATALTGAFYCVSGTTLYGFEVSAVNGVTGAQAVTVSTSADAVSFASAGTLTIQFSGDGVQEGYDSSISVSAIGSTLIAVAFFYYLDNSDVEFAENLIYVSTDGGANWSQTYQDNVIGGGVCFWGPRSASDGSAVYFAAETFPYAISAAKIMSTSDGITVSTELTYDATGNGVSGPASIIYSVSPIAVWPTVATNSYLVADAASLASVSVSSTTSVTPITADLLMSAETTGAAQSNQQMFLKNSEQAWIYTR